MLTRHKRRQIQRYTFCVVGATVLTFVMYTYHLFFASTLENDVDRTTIKDNYMQLPLDTCNGHKPHIVFGILTSENSSELREAQRNTWIRSAMQSNIPFKLTYHFLIDHPTIETIKENNIYRDIVFLNTTYTGRAVRFGEKMFKWWKYIYENYPDAELGAKIDNDAFLCVPQIFQKLCLVKSSKLYYGWWHTVNNGWWPFYKEKIGVDRRMDEMFVVLGRDLIERIAKRKYCDDKDKCDVNKDLVDTDFGGTSIGQWLSRYSDIDVQVDNDRIIHFGNDQIVEFAAYVRPDFCEQWVIYHKATPKAMQMLNDYNTRAMLYKAKSLKSNEDAGFVVQETATTGSVFAGTEIRQLPQLVQYFQPRVKVEKDDQRTCDNWAVVTTIFKPSEAIARVAKAPNWCLVIVADVQTPNKDIYLKSMDLKGEAEKRVKYLAIDEQAQLYPALAEIIPYKHFGRKNIGYIYAIQHNANVIWDFDDDNLGIIDTNDLNAISEKLVAVCNDLPSPLVNPYPYFGVKDNRTWPRGFPLQKIKDKRLTPNICQLKEKPNLGVVQSLANEEPDLDAIFRLNRDVPFNFSAKIETHPSFVVPKNVYTPFNAQATLWTRAAFFYLALPVSVNGRVSDIWRSYIALHFMHKEGLQLAFTPPYVTQHRNAHTNLKDFNAELPLYERSGQLVQFLSSKKASDIPSVMNMYEHLYNRGYIELNDLKLMDVWTKTFKLVTEY